VANYVFFQRWGNWEKVRQYSAAVDPNGSPATSCKDSFTIVLYWFHLSCDVVIMVHSLTIYLLDSLSSCSQNTTPMQVDRSPWGWGLETPAAGFHFPGQLSGLPGQMPQGIGGIQTGQAPVSV
jgi:hypothetical protein